MKDQDPRARKRAAIGLGPARPTAKRDIQRPPSGAIPLWRLRWLGVLIGAMVCATALLMLATLQRWPTHWNDVRETLLNPPVVAGEGEMVVHELDAGPYRRLAEASFSSADGGLAAEALPNQYRIWTDAESGLYRMRVWPDNLAWSILGKTCLGPYRLETTAAVSPASPTAYAGLLGRFQNTHNFYLFAVDGQGNYRVSAQIDGVWSTLQPWTPSPAINTGGVANKLALQDDGRTLNFLSNDMLLFGVSNLALPAGNTGLAGGSPAQVGELFFDWLRLYDLPCRVF